MVLVSAAIFFFQEEAQQIKSSLNIGRHLDQTINTSSNVTYIIFKVVHDQTHSSSETTKTASTEISTPILPYQGGTMSDEIYVPPLMANPVPSVQSATTTTNQAPAPPITYVQDLIGTESLDEDYKEDFSKYLE